MQNPVMMPSQPQLGTPVPGTTGGLPPVPGLSVTRNPMAQQLQSMGRGDDTMLVHMTPGEVNSLQGLAMAAGGSLTINPMTGLPEASFLKKLLPTLLGVGLSFIPGVGPLMAAGIVGAGQTALTGDLSKGLMAGLGAFGGASLAGAAGIGAAAKAGAVKAGAAAPLGKAAEGTVQHAFDAALNVKPEGFISKFGEAARGGMTGLAGKAAPYAAGMGLLNTVSEATAPKLPTYDPDAEQKSNYVPMGPGVREVRYQTPEQMRESGGAEFQYFTPSNPEPVPLYGQPRRFAEGGAASAPADDFDELVQYFGATNPGAITASMYPTSPAAAPGAAAPAPRQGGEVIHDFGRRTAGNLGLTDTSSLYGTFPGLGALSGLNFDMAGYDTMIRRLRGDLGLGAPPPTGPFTPSAPSTSNMNSYGEPSASIGSPTQVLPEFTGGEVPYYTPDQLGPQYTPPFTPSAPVYNPTQPFTPSEPVRPYMPPVAPAAPVSPVSPFAPEQNVLLPYTPDETPAMPSFTPDMPSVMDMAPVAPYVPPVMPEPMPVSAPGVPPPPAIPAPAPILPSNAPRLMTDLPGGENYGGPYYTTVPTGPEEDYTPNYGSMFDLYEQNMLPEYARGGAVNMRDGSFVVDARTVSELGNGSSNAGIEMLSRMGGRPVRGPGDGVSDSVRASIGGKQEARVARDEVIFPPEAVRRVGGGSEARGTKKLYALMNKAHKARKKAKRGQDTGVRRGLA